MRDNEKIPEKIWSQIKKTEDTLLDQGVQFTANDVFKKIKTDFFASERNRDAYAYLFESPYLEIANFHRHLISGVLDRGKPIITTEEPTDVLPSSVGKELDDIQRQFKANNRKPFSYSIERYVRQNKTGYPQSYDYFFNCSIEESLYRSAILARVTNESELIEKDRDYEDFSR